ncbi:hypothetical protein, partial [Actinokineospora sp.]|uniref:hypothetical protein n=1 Tax=Actinokineospora sp. TaxID=1872133 RepID=UPI003D6AEB91
CATNASTITAAVGLYTPTMQADDMPNDTTPSGSGMVTVDLDVLAPLTFTLITADAGTTMACSGGTFDDSTAGGNAPDAATGRTYGDPQCDLLFTASGARAPYTWNTNSPAPAPIACTQEGMNGEFFRCNSGGAAVTGGAATLGVDVTDTGNAALPGITQDTDDQMHMGHLINIAPDLVLNLITTDPASFAGCTGGTFDDSTFGGSVPDGVFGRTYGDPQCDLLFRASGGIPDPTNGYSWPVIGAPLELSCTEETELVMDDRLRCNSGGAGFSGVGTFVFGAAVQDAGNDTTPDFTQTADDQGHTDGTQAAHNININNEVSVVSDLGDPLPTAVQGQPYGEAPATPATFTATGGLGGTTGFTLATTTGGTMNGDLAFPADIMCGQTAPDTLSCATMMGTITAAVGTYTPTVDADDVANDTTPDSVTAGTTAMVTVNIDVVAAMMFTLVTADPAMTACAGGTFMDTTGDAPDAVTGRTYGDP